MTAGHKARMKGAKFKMTIPKYVVYLLKSCNATKLSLSIQGKYAVENKAVYGYMVRLSAPGAYKYLFPPTFLNNIEKMIKWANKNHAEAELIRIYESHDAVFNKFINISKQKPELSKDSLGFCC